MNCTRCGSANVAVRRDDTYFCSRCAVARDWEDIIAIAQVARTSPHEFPFEAEPAVSAANGNGGGVPADPFSAALAD